MDLNTNLNAAPGAVLAEALNGANVALTKGGVPIQSAITTPTYYFGIASNSIQENVTVGAGTPWLGISTDVAHRRYNVLGGTNNTITANSDFSLQALANTNQPFQLSLGNGASTTDIVKISTPNGGVNAKIVGTVYLDNDHSQYGSAGNTVTFQVTSGATLVGYTANAQGVIAGAASAPARIVVQNKWRHS